jgi:hypothetical protein
MWAVAFMTLHGGYRGSNPGGVRFSVPVQTGPEARPASCTIGTGSFPGVKRPGRGGDLPPPSSAEVTNGLNLHLRLSPVPPQVYDGVTL